MLHVYAFAKIPFAENQHERNSKIDVFSRSKFITLGNNNLDIRIKSWPFRLVVGYYYAHLLKISI